MAKLSAEKIVKDFLEKLITEIGFKAEISVVEGESIEANISGEELGALIGYRGETLESLQLLVNLVLNRQLKTEEGEWKRVVVDIGNWRNERKEALGGLVGRAAIELKDRGAERIALNAMTPSQRREVHVIVSENYPEISSESEGEEPNRRIVLSLKKH